MNDRSNTISRLQSDQDFRAGYIRSKLDVLIPAQIRALRGEMTQGELGGRVDMKQSRISAMETPGAVNFNLETLVRIAAAFKVGLAVKFVPFSDMLRWENHFAPDRFYVTPLEEDVDFTDPVEPLGQLGYQQSFVTAADAGAVCGQIAPSFNSELPPSQLSNGTSLQPILLEPAANE